MAVHSGITEGRAKTFSEKKTTKISLFSLPVKGERKNEKSPNFFHYTTKKKERDLSQDVEAIPMLYFYTKPTDSDHKYF